MKGMDRMQGMDRTKGGLRVPPPPHKGAGREAVANA